MLDISPRYAPLVPACKAYGVGRSSGFKYARSGDLEVVKIGSRTYVILESLRTLPERLAEKSKAEAA